MRELLRQISIYLASVVVLLPLAACDMAMEHESTFVDSALIELTGAEVSELLTLEEDLTIIDVSPMSLQGTVPSAHPFPSDLAQTWADFKSIEGSGDFLLVSAGDVDLALISEKIGDRIKGTLYFYRGDASIWKDAGVTNPSHLGPDIIGQSLTTIKPHPNLMKLDLKVPAFRPYMTVDADVAAELIETVEEMRIIDVSPGFDEGHIPGAESFPYSGMGFVNAALLQQDQMTPYLVYGSSEIMAKVAARAMVTNGFETVFFLHGNIAAWVEAGYPIERATLEIVDAPLPGDGLAVPDEIVRDLAQTGPTYWEEIVWEQHIDPPGPVADKFRGLRLQIQ